MLNVNQLMLNLYALQQLPVFITNTLLTTNTVTVTNRHRRVLLRQAIDEPLTLPKGACRAVTGPLRFF